MPRSRVNAAVSATLAQPAFIERLKDLGTYPMAQSREQAARFIQAEKLRWETVIHDAGVKPE